MSKKITKFALFTKFTKLIKPTQIFILILISIVLILSFGCAKNPNSLDNTTQIANKNSQGSADSPASSSSSSSGSSSGSSSSSSSSSSSGGGEPKQVTPPAGGISAVNMLSTISGCTSACEEHLQAGEDLSNGPCLLDPMPSNSQIVCDVAHSPRIAVDDLEQNQCKSFLEGKATKFIEVTPECKLIRVH